MTTADAAAVAAPEAGRAAAARAIYEEHYAALARFAYRLTGNASTAEDVVHEAFARLMTRWLGVRKPVPFLYRTVANLGNDVWRAARRDAAFTAAAVAESVAPFDPSLHDAVRRLPRPERDAVTLYYFADLPVGDVAQLLGKPDGTVKWLLSNARDRLATELGDHHA